MKGLLLKDFCIFGKSAKFYILYLVGMAVLGLGMKSSAFIVGIVVMMLSILCISTFSYDDMARWPAYAAALPVSRGKVVLSKYALGMGMPLLGGVVALLITVGYSFIRPENMVENALTAGLTACVGMLFNLILLPPTFKWGAEKSRIILYAAMAAVFAIVFLAEKLPALKLPSLPQLPTGLWVGLIAAVMVGLTLISYGVSCRIYAKKEF
ncbi:ABC-2 transporter permease [Bittarella sp. HCP28S3_D9]|uniref:ABC-2 transporter permease n=1 Tax=Bittarella sp. HCP28S3_D9 TaxID=3440253 RepID=UPI003F890C8E